MYIILKESFRLVFGIFKINSDGFRMVNQTLTTCHQIQTFAGRDLKEGESDNLTSLPSTVHVSRVSLMFPAGQEVKVWLRLVQATINESSDVLIDLLKCEPAKGVVKKML